MRENDQTQRTKTQGDLIPERKPVSNVPLMSMAPISSTTNNNTSSSYYKDLTTTLFEQKPAQPFYGMSTSQTMPSLMQPTIAHPIKPAQNFSSSTHTADLTASLMNNLSSLGPRPQMTPMAMPVNSMNGMGGGNMGLFQPPRPSIPSGLTMAKGTNVSTPKSAAAELDDLFN